MGVAVYYLEAHGDSARIVIEDSSIDLGTIEGRACLQALSLIHI